MFERNNWNTRLGILPTERARWIEQQNGRKVYNPAMAYLPKGVKASVAAGSIPQVMTLSTGVEQHNQNMLCSVGTIQHSV